MDKPKFDYRGYLFFAILGGFVAYMIWNNPSIDVDIQSYKTQINILQQRIAKYSLYVLNESVNHNLPS